MEPETARRWECGFFRLPFDLSRISWVLTSNSLKRVNPAVLSRCQVIELPDVTATELEVFARRRGAAMDLSQDSIEAVAEVLRDAPRITRRRFSLRDAIRMLERAEALETRPLLH